MTIKELIKGLQKCKRKNAKVIITCGNEDNDTLSTSDFEICSDTSRELGYIELFINEEHCSKQL